MMYVFHKMTIDEKYSLSPEHNELIRKMETLVALIKLQLNPHGEIDKNIIRILNRVPYYASVPNAQFLDDSEWLLLHCQWLLKEEWEKVKYESMGVIGRYCWALPKRIMRSRAYSRFAATERKISP